MGRSTRLLLPAMVITVCRDPYSLEKQGHLRGSSFFIFWTGSVFLPVPVHPVITVRIKKRYTVESI